MGDVVRLQEMDAQRLELSPIYSQIILKYSSYDKPQQDRMFFECLYETLVGAGRGTGRRRGLTGWDTGGRGRVGTQGRRMGWGAGRGTGRKCGYQWVETQGRRRG